MSNKQTTPAEGLRFAALTVMEWLRQRIGEDIPPELVQPEPERYKEADDSCLPSLHIHRGYVVDIVALPSQGVWSRQITEPDLGSEPGKPAQQRLRSLHIHRGYFVDIVSLPSQGVWSKQITEPDLGSEPGNPAQQRQAVPGRVIETNIGFCIQGKTRECGFQTVISDPVGSGAQAAVSQEKSPPTSTRPYNAGAFAEKRKGCCLVYLLDAALIKYLADEVQFKLRH